MTQLDTRAIAELVLGGTAGAGPRSRRRPRAGRRARARRRHRHPAGLTAALDRYMATRAGVAGLAVRDNRNGRYFGWRPADPADATAPSRC